MRSRLRVATDYARMQGLIPKEKKGGKAESDAVFLAQVNDISPEERRRHNREHNAACLMTFVDVLVDLACEQWKAEREITELSLRGDFMKKEGIVVKNYWDKLSGNSS